MHFYFCFLFGLIRHEYRETWVEEIHVNSIPSNKSSQSGNLFDSNSSKSQSISVTSSSSPDQIYVEASTCSPDSNTAFTISREYCSPSKLLSFLLSSHIPRVENHPFNEIVFCALDESWIILPQNTPATIVFKGCLFPKRDDYIFVILISG